MENDYGLLYWAAGSFAVGGIFYLFYDKRCRLVETLQQISCFVPNEKLVKAVDNNGGYLPYAAVTGVAKADDNHLYGIRKPTLQGLISHFYVVEHTREQSTNGSIWSKSKQPLSDLWSAVPFSLGISQSRIRVSVCEPLKAYNLNLTTVHDHYEPSNVDVATRLLDHFFGHHVVGIQSIEKMLLPDTKLTAIGKVVLHDGHLRVEPSEDYGLKYFLTADSIESVIKSEEAFQFTFKVFMIIFLGIGGVLCGLWLRNYYQKYKEQLEFQRLEAENNIVNDDGEDRCVVCLVNAKNIVLVPCGHVCGCKWCLERVDKCPMCRKAIERKIPIYY